MKIKELMNEEKSVNEQRVLNVIYNVLQSYLPPSKNDEASERIINAIKKHVKL